MRSALSLIVACALSIAAAVAQTDASGDELLKHARQLYIQEGPSSALPEFERALADFRSAGDRHGEAVTLGFMANCYRKLEKLDRALELGQQALAMKTALGDRAEVGKTENQLGLVYWEKADYASAVAHLQRSIEIANSVGDQETEGSARNNLGLVFDEQGDHQHSLEQYQRALTIHRAAHFERGEGDTLGNIGGVYLLLGEFRNALPYYQQALAISERLGLKPASSDDLGNLALCLAGTGDIEGALQYFDRAMEAAHDAGLAKEEADWRKGKASTLVRLGRYDAALQEYAAAQKVYEQAGLKRELVEALLDTGYVYELLGDSQDAETRFQQSQSLAKTIGNESGEITSLIALADLERRRKAYEAAELHYEEAEQRAITAGNKGLQIAALTQQASNDVDRKQYQQAIIRATKAVQRSEQLGNPPATAGATYALAEARRSNQEFESALQQYASAATLNANLHDPELQWRLLFGEGQALAATGKPGEAIAAFKHAVEVIEQTRAALAEEQYRAGYLDDRYEVYVALVELLLKQGDPAEAFFYSEKLRARAYFDQLGVHRPLSSDPEVERRLHELGEQIRTLRKAIETEYSSRQQQRRGQALEQYTAELGRAEREYQSLIQNAEISSAGAGETHPVQPATEIQAHLPADAALLEYVVWPLTVSILLVRRESVVGIAVPVSAESLASRTELLGQLIRSKRAEWATPAQGLRRLLYDPVAREGYLSDVHHLLIVGDGVLNDIPFAALPITSERYLGDLYTITYLPAAAAIVRDTRSSGRKLLAVAPGSAHLPNAIAEVRAIGQLFPGSRVLVGREPTKALFEQIAGDYDYLHLATHGNLNRVAPWLSSLDLEPIGDNDGRLEVYEIAQLKLHARLVTLSACESALARGNFSDVPGGDEFVGLTRAFLSAGGQNVLASLWAVNDEASQRLMVRFYKRLDQNTGAKALALAQRDLRRMNPSYRHPYYWAAFVMYGPDN